MLSDGFGSRAVAYVHAFAQPWVLSRDEYQATSGGRRNLSVGDGLGAEARVVMIFQFVLPAIRTVFTFGLVGRSLFWADFRPATPTGVPSGGLLD